MDSNIEKTLENVKGWLEAAEEVISQWKGESSLKVPEMMEKIAIKHNWDAKELKDAEPFIRYHFRNHSSWYIERGSRGGIRSRQLLAKKLAIKDAKEQLKQEIENSISLANTTSVNNV